MIDLKTPRALDVAQASSESSADVVRTITAPTTTFANDSFEASTIGHAKLQLSSGGLNEGPTDAEVK